MTRTLFVICVGLLASAVLAGCASTGDVSKVSERLDVLEGKLTKDLETSAASVKKTEEDLGAADARLKAVEKKVDDKISSLEAELSNVQRSLKSIGDDIKKLNDGLAAYRGTNDGSLQAMVKRLAKTEADAAEATKQLPAVQAEITRFGIQFKQMSSSIKEAQGLMIKSMENARDIYKTQFLALEEVLQNLKKPAKTKEPEPPK